MAQPKVLISLSKYNRLRDTQSLLHEAQSQNRELEANLQATGAWIEKCSEQAGRIVELESRLNSVGAVCEKWIERADKAETRVQELEAERTEGKCEVNVLPVEISCNGRLDKEVIEAVLAAAAKKAWKGARAL